MNPRALLGLLILCMLLSGCETTKETDSDHSPERIAAANVELGLAYMRENENDVALQKFNRALKADPDYVPAHIAMGLLYQRLGDNNHAEKYYKQALRLAPDNPQALNSYGQYLCQTGRTSESEKYFLKAAENRFYQAPEVAYTNAGICALREGNVDKGEQYFRSALEFNPNVTTALFHMADISYNNQSYLSARGYLQRYLELSDQSPQILWLGIRIERELGDKDAVASYSLALKANYPNSNEAQLLRESERK
ncbi:MAG: type IV pilus biogenesis/stability protein PilW [Gammaproteobacteria bacterium]|nr:type IV pilus biogenesis/stability protein PilW [Gammaproteobacteria bacterium]MCI0591102.1 type IV pilus biogenesis/stability protein PilW [Gammaproteobacteria bacterium]